MPISSYSQSFDPRHWGARVPRIVGRSRMLRLTSCFSHVNDGPTTQSRSNVCIRNLFIVCIVQPGRDEHSPRRIALQNCHYKNKPF